MKRVDVAIAGAGSRGYGYASYVRDNPDAARVVAVAEPRPDYRERLVSEHDIKPENIFSDWRDMADRPRLADAMIVSTQDHMHVEPAIAFAEKGYHILLEKPMAPSEEGCRRIAEAVEASGIFFACGHVLRYTPYTTKLKEIVSSGKIGEVVGIQRLEAVGFWHQAHSYVRGNWNNESKSSFMLLAKCSHDIDWIGYVMGSKFKAVSSFGSLKHFRSEEAPSGATDRCCTCPVEPECPYSAIRIYDRFLEEGDYGWPLDILSPNPSRESIEEALRTGPYGRCVYACDNDVVDHQVVGMEFENGGTATLTMMAFSKSVGRKTEVFGTRGHIIGDGSLIQVYDFLSDSTEEIDTRASDGTITGGHGGGDQGLMKSFLSAVAAGDQSLILSNCEDTLRSHLAVFAAERARINRTVESVE